MVSREHAHILELEQKKNITRETQASPSSNSSKTHHDDANQQHKEAGHPTASNRLDTPSRPGQETEISSPDIYQTRHCNQVNG